MSVRLWVCMQETEDVCRSQGFEAEPDPLLQLLSADPGMEVTLTDTAQFLRCSDLKRTDRPGLAKLYCVSATVMMPHSLF